MTSAKTISVEEAGRQLGLGRNLAYRAVHDGHIPCLKIGRKLRVPISALDRMLAEATPLHPAEKAEAQQ